MANPTHQGVHMRPRVDGLADVIVATMATAAAAGRDGTYTDEVEEALASVVARVAQSHAERVSEGAEFDAFALGWQEATASVRLPRQNNKRYTKGPLTVVAESEEDGGNGGAGH